MVVIPETMEALKNGTSLFARRNPPAMEWLASSQANKKAKNSIEEGINAVLLLMVFNIQLPPKIVIIEKHRNVSKQNKELLIYSFLISLFLLLILNWQIWGL